MAAFCPYFLRCESDVMESFSHVKNILELRELKWENCLINSGSPEKLVDFVWSITGHSVEESIKVRFQLAKLLVKVCISIRSLSQCNK